MSDAVLIAIRRSVLEVLPDLDPMRSPRRCH